MVRRNNRAAVVVVHGASRVPTRTCDEVNRESTFAVNDMSAQRGFCNERPAFP